MKKILTNVLCFFIPVKKWRKLLRAKLLNARKTEKNLRPKIKAISKIISSYKDTNPYYSIYKNSEYSYWEKAIQWLWADNNGKKNLKVLDIGCACGTLSLFCAKEFNASVLGIDFIDNYYSPSMFKDFGIDWKKCNIELEDLPTPYNKEKFDIIILTEVLEHFNFNPIPTLQKIASYLNTNGILYITTPNAKYWGKTTKYYNALNEIPNINEKTKVVDDHVWQYSIAELFETTYKSGLEVIDFDYSNNGRQFNLSLKKINNQND